MGTFVACEIHASWRPKSHMIRIGRRYQCYPTSPCVLNPPPQQAEEIEVECVDPATGSPRVQENMESEIPGGYLGGDNDGAEEEEEEVQTTETQDANDVSPGPDTAQAAAWEEEARDWFLSTRPCSPLRPPRQPVPPAGGPVGQLHSQHWDAQGCQATSGRVRGSRSSQVRRSRRSRSHSPRGRVCRSRSRSCRGQVRRNRSRSPRGRVRRSRSRSCRGRVCRSLSHSPRGRVCGSRGRSPRGRCRGSTSVGIPVEQSPGVSGSGNEFTIANGKLHLVLCSRGKDHAGPPWPSVHLACRLAVQKLYQQESKQYCNHSGQHPQIRRLLREHVRFWPLMHQVVTSAEQAREGGHTEAVMDIVCNHGRHRSVAFVEEAAELLKGYGYKVSVLHLCSSSWKRNCKAGTCGTCTGA